MPIGHAFEFISLRIARVIGPGIKKTASPWRSRIFETPRRDASVQIPFAPEAQLSLVHVEDVARMLVMLAETTGVRSSVYNTPAELWQARELFLFIERPVQYPRNNVSLNPSHEKNFLTVYLLLIYQCMT